MCQEQGIQIVDFRFVDLFGLQQHTAITVYELTEEVFRLGTGFDGSSIRGFQEIHESDMMLVPDPDTAFVDPILSVPTLAMFCNVVDPITRENYSRDPRWVAQKAEAYLRTTGIADASYWGPEPEFFIFDHIRFDQTTNSGYYFIDSHEGIWNSGLEQGGHNLGYRPAYKEGYFPVPPIDTLMDVRSEIVNKLTQVGVHMEKHHHEVATAGQCEIDMRYNTLTKMADQLL
ncbi:MAG: glutamine synthetase beta-grasp domain-containing protein, partial [Chloroflexi bacterium]|nr:glutamine synthetase beta-grasp domain-containing protein [Chloroflexota bacterium]